MLKQMLKMANVPNEKALRKKYPTEADFLREHGAQMLYMYGGNYAEGGMTPEDAAMQQGAAQQQGGDGQAQQEQIVQMIAQALQQGAPEDQIIAKLVEMGLPEDQAAQMVQMVKQKLQEQMGGGQQQMSPEEAQMQQQQQGAPMGRYGGMYDQGGMYDDSRGLVNKGMTNPYDTRGIVNAYSYGGPTHNNSTYSAGVSYKKGGSFNNPGFNALPDFVQQQIMANTAMYGGMYNYGGMYATGGEPCVGAHMIRNEEGRCVCEEGFEADQMTGECYAIGEESPDDEAIAEANQTAGTRPVANGPGGAPIPGGGLNAGFGLEGNNYNLNYGFGVGSDLKSNVAHSLDFKIPKAFRLGVNSGDIGLKGNYAPGKSWSGAITAGVPLSGIKGRGDLLRFTGGMGQQFNDPELTKAMDPAADNFMRVNSGKAPIAYNAGVEYLGKMFGAKGPNVKIKASYSKQKRGGSVKTYEDGGFLTTNTSTLNPNNILGRLASESTSIQKPMVLPPMETDSQRELRQFGEMAGTRLTREQKKAVENMSDDQGAMYLREQYIKSLTPAQQEAYRIQQAFLRKDNERRGIRVNKYGGLTKFVGGGMPEEQAAGQDQQQQLMQQVAQMLQQGAQPEQVLQQLVQMGIPQDQAQQLIQMIMQQMQGGGAQQPPMRMGGMTNKKYKKGGEYNMSQSDIQDLIKKGYKIQYL